MTPTESDCGSPKGEPMATTGAPTFSARDEPSGSGRSVSPAGSIRRRATSESGSTPTIVAGDLVAVGELRRRPPSRASASSPWPVGHDVRVRGDLAVAVQDEPRAERPPARGSAVEHAAAAEHAEDGHHARRLALVDRAAGRRPPPLPRRRRRRPRRASSPRRSACARPRRRRRASTPPSAAPATTSAHAATRARLTPAASSANVVAPDVVCTSRRPVMRSASSRAIVSPRPEPCASSEV